MRRSLPVFAQIVQLIPAGLIGKLAEACRIKARNFPYAHQIYALMLGQLAGAFSLNEICDAMAVHFKKLFRVRGLLPARRNTFSNANRTRDPAARLRRLRVHHPARYPLPADPPPRRLPPARPRRHPRPPRLQLRVPPPAGRVGVPPRLAGRAVPSRNPCHGQRTTEPQKPPKVFPPRDGCSGVQRAARAAKPSRRLSLSGCPSRSSSGAASTTAIRTEPRPPSPRKKCSASPGWSTRDGTGPPPSFPEPVSGTIPAPTSASSPNTGRKRVSSTSNPVSRHGSGIAFRKSADAAKRKSTGRCGVPPRLVHGERPAIPTPASPPGRGRSGWKRSERPRRPPSPPCLARCRRGPPPGRGTTPARVRRPRG